MSIPALHERRLMALPDARPHLRTGDLLQYRGSRWHPISMTTRAIGRSPYSHSATIEVVDEDRIDCLEVREFWGGRITALEWQIETFRAIDVFRPSPLHSYWDGAAWQTIEFTDERRRQLADVMRGLCRPGEYGYSGAVQTWLTHIPVLRWLLPIQTNDKCGRGVAPYCSEAYCHAFRLAFVDPVPNKPDWLTEPGDLTRSPLLANYMFTLV